MKTYAEAILDATDLLLGTYPTVHLMGLGVPDPLGIFGTTKGLAAKYPQRVLDLPVSENAMMGVAIGMAIRGLRPIMTHQRADFFFLALDQLINNAAKWRFMFGDLMRVPLVIRLIMGRGWGQGPQHSQALHALLAHIPGLKVVMPSTPCDAKGLLIAAVEDDDPVLYIEHRWLHPLFGTVPQGLYRTPIGKARLLSEGTELTLVAYSHMTLEAHIACRELSVDLIDLRSIRPFDEGAILTSVRKTGRLLVCDPDHLTAGFAAEIVARVAESGIPLRAPPVRIAYPDQPCPTSWLQSQHYYPTSHHIRAAILKLLGQQAPPLEPQGLLDVPNKQFTGPF